MSWVNLVWETYYDHDLPPIKYYKNLAKRSNFSGKYPIFYRSRCDGKESLSYATGTNGL